MEHQGEILLNQVLSKQSELSGQLSQHIGQVQEFITETRIAIGSITQAQKFHSEGQAVIISRLDKLNGKTERHGEWIAENKRAIAVLEDRDERDTSQSMRARREESADRIQEHLSTASSDAEKSGKNIALIKWVFGVPWVGQAVIILILVFAIQGSLLEIVKGILKKWGM